MATQTSSVRSAVLIGYGSIGRYHARLLQQRHEQLAIVDFNKEAQRQARDVCPQATVVSNCNMLEQQGWDWARTVAVIATWGPSHGTVFADLATRGIHHILCEKPLAHSVKVGADMIASAQELGITLGVHHHLRYSNFATGLSSLAHDLELGPPCAVVFHGGTLGHVTSGIHYIDLASELFGQGPESVIGSVVGDPINPRSPALRLYGGSAVWDFGQGRELSMCFSNLSSVNVSMHVYYRNAMVNVSPYFDVEVLRRDQAEIEKFPAVTRIGVPTDVAFAGDVPGKYPIEACTHRLLDEIESGHIEVLPPALALQALSACIGAIEAGEKGRRVSLPIDPMSELGKKEWPIS